jgi:hypothetical protein
MVPVLGEQSVSEAVSPSNVYVGSNVVQVQDADVFTTFTLTNTTAFWFNPRVYLINLDGEIVRQFAPLIKGYGSWQKTSVDLISEDFQGSVWIISPQPIVAAAFIHQLRQDGTVSLVATNGLERMDRDEADAAIQHLSGE